MDPSGHYVETIYDAYSLGDSLVELIKEPSLENAWWAAFDAASIIAPIPAGGKVARAADDAVDAVRAGNKVVDGVKGAKKVKVKPKVSKKVKRVKKASKTPKIKSKKGSVKKSAKTKGKSALKNSGSLWSPTEKVSDLWNKGKLKKHYEKHGITEFGAKSSKEYSEMAYEFGTRKSSSIIQVTEGAYVYRYEPSTRTVFVGTLKGGKIKSFYKWDGRTNDNVIQTLKRLGKM